jgi:hypothetical protein
VVAEWLAAEGATGVVEVQITGPTEDHGETLTVEPTVECGCRLEVHVEDESQLDLRVGRAARFDLHGPADEVMARLHDVLVAVLHGRVEETVWTRQDGRPFRSRATIDISGKALRVRWAEPGLLPLLRSSRQKIEYCSALNPRPTVDR